MRDRSVGLAYLSVRLRRRPLTPLWVPTPLSDLGSQSREDRGERCLENTNSDTTAEIIEAGDALKTDNTDAIPRCHFSTLQHKMIREHIVERVPQ